MIDDPWLDLTHPHSNTSGILIRHGVASSSCLVDCAFGHLIWIWPTYRTGTQRVYLYLCMLHCICICYI